MSSPITQALLDDLKSELNKRLYDIKLNLRILDENADHYRSLLVKAFDDHFGDTLGNKVMVIHFRNEAHQNHGITF